MDSKKSPLALLAQTCSQIGSDSPAVPSLASKSGEQKKKDARDKASPVSGASSVDSVRAADKRKPESGCDEPKRSATPGEKRAKSSSPRTQQKAADPPAGISQNAAFMSDPAALAASYKSLMAASFPFASYPGAMPPGSGYPAALDAYANALNAAVAKSAMPPPMMNAYLAHNPAYLAALQYSRMGKGDCRDPYCTGCPPSSSAVQMVCVAGCALSTQCDHPKVPIPAHLSSSAPPTSPSGAPVKPYVCNWIVADNYCGKRFATSDDLLQHLRTHTNAAQAAAQQSDLGALGHPLLGQSFAPGAHPSLRAYPTPPLSPLSAARYHPYGKSPAPGSSGQQASPTQPPGYPPGLFHPLYSNQAPHGPSHPGLYPHPALAPYYSHLSLFGPRPLGSAPLPP